MPKEKSRMPKALNAGEAEFAFHCKLNGLEPKSQFKFDPCRKWHLDFAFPEFNLAIEIEGGVWTMGRHTRGSGFIRDIEKYNALAIDGWRLLRFTPQMVTAGTAIETVLIAIGCTTPV